MTKITGFTAGAFDLLHAGHVLMLEEASSRCDYLLVGLQTDPSVDRPTKNAPVQSLEERLIQLKAVRYVDEVVIYETEADLLLLLEKHDINVRVIGADYIGKDFTGKDLCINKGIEIYHNSRSHSYSTTELRQRVIAASSA